MIVKDGSDRLAQAVEQFHLHLLVPAALATNPESLLAIHEEAVAVEGESQTPARIPCAQVLERCIPDEPVEQQRFACAEF